MFSRGRHRQLKDGPSRCNQQDAHQDHLIPEYGTMGREFGRWFNPYGALPCMEIWPGAAMEAQGIYNVNHADELLRASYTK